MPSAFSRNRCAWCYATLDDKIVYNLTTRVAGVTQIHIIGGECCLAAGRHADFANRHGRPPMYFDYATTLSNVRKLYVSARLCQEPSTAAFMIRIANETRLKLCKADQARALWPLRRSARS